MKKRQNEAKKLRLSRETLRDLKRSEAQGAAGGNQTFSSETGAGCCTVVRTTQEVCGTA